MVRTMKTAVFYADILGFSIAAAEPGAGRALGQLADVAQFLSTEDSLANYLQREVWNVRYGLSDSIFLLARDAADACLAAVMIGQPARAGAFPRQVRRGSCGDPFIRKLGNLS
jgi:hypothetical protein